MSTDNFNAASCPSDNLTGIWLMLAGFAAFSCGDLIAKLLTADYHPVQIAFPRQLSVVAVVAVLFAMKGSAILRSAAPKLQVARGLCAVVSATGFMLTSVIVLAIPMPLIWTTPVSIVDVAMMAGVAIMAGMGEYLLIRALEIAAAVVVAPVQYSLRSPE